MSIFAAVFSDMNHNQPKVIISGGSSGIGRATAELFAKCGYCVFELSRHDVYGSNYPGITHISCDVTLRQSCQEAIAQVMAATGGEVEALVCNAGIGISGSIEHAAVSDVEKQMNVNFWGAFHLVQFVLPWLRQQHKGHIVFVGSVMGEISLPFQAFYCASKAAVESMALSLRNEVRPLGISVSCVLPGDVQTAFTQTRQKSIVGADIYTHLEQSIRVMEADEEHGLLPLCVAKTIYAQIRSRHPRATVVVGGRYRLLTFVANIVPQSVVSWVVSKMY